MPDPFSLIITAHAIGGAASGAAKHLTESVLSSGRQWLSERFKNHLPKAIEKAKSNAESFLNTLALQVARLEENQQIDRSIIDRALEEPGFGALLQSALIGSAETESSEKHDLLVSLIVGRITTDSESVFAVAARMATQAVIHATRNQLRILGFLSSFSLKWNGLPSDSSITHDNFLTVCRPWFEHRFAAYGDLNVRLLDLSHLEALSCLNFLPFLSIDLNDVLRKCWSNGQWSLDRESIMDFSVGASIVRSWNSGLDHVRQTSIGELIGVLTSDRLCSGNSTRFGDEWVGAT